MRITPLLLSLVFCSVLATAQSTVKEVKIAFMLDHPHKGGNYQILVDEVSALLGYDYHVTIEKPKINGNSLEMAKKNYQELIAQEADLIISIGLTSGYFFYQHENVEIPTLIIGGVNKSLIDIPSNQTGSNKNNVNFLVLSSSFEDDVDEFYSIYPYKKLGVIIEKEQIDVLPVEQLFDGIFSKRTSSYKLIPMEKPSIDFNELNDIDAVYIAENLHADSTKTKTLINQLIQRKIASFSANGITEVELGILATNRPQALEKQFIRKVALHVEAIVGGENAANLPVYVDYNNSLTINYGTLSKLGIQLKYSILGIADFIGNEDVNGEEKLGLADVFNRVLNKNLSLSIEEKEVEKAIQDVKASKTNYHPEVTANLQTVYLDPEVAKVSNGQNPEITSDGSIQLKQLLYSQDATSGIKIKNEISKAQQASYNSKQLDALVEAAGAYFQALILKTNVNIHHQNLQLTKKNYEVANENYSAGASGKSDVLRFKSQIAQNTQNLIDANNKLSQAYLSLNQLMNNSISSKIELKDTDLDDQVFEYYNYDEFMELFDSPELLPILIDFFIEESYQNSPELKNIDFNMEANRLNYKLNSAGRFVPTVALQGQYSSNFLRSGEGTEAPLGFPQAPTSSYNAALNISLPIYNQNTRNVNRQMAKIQGEQLQLQEQSIRQNFEKNIRDITYDLMGNMANIEISIISEEAAKESLELTQTAYKNGAVPIIQLLDAQTNYLQAKQARATAIYQFLISSMKLERFMGYFLLTHTKEENEAFFERAQQYVINKRN